MYLSVRVAIAAAVASTVAALLPLPMAASLAVVNAALALAVLIDVLGAPRAASLRLVRTAPGVSSTDRSDVVTIRGRNPLDRALEVAVHDASRPSLARSPLRMSALVAPRDAFSLAATLSPNRRGRSSLGPITVRTAGRLRLAGRQERIEDRQDLRVLPPLPGRAVASARLQRARHLQSGARVSAVRGGGNDFDSLRDYHTDDEFRRINWIATARAAKPISNVYREERNQHVTLLLDAGRGMASSIDGAPRFELAIDAAFALAQLATGAGDSVGMVAFGDRVFASIGARGGRDQPRRILDRLFDLEPVLAAPDYRAAFSQTLSSHRRRALLVLLTDLTDEAAMEPLFATLPLLLSRHLLVVGAIRDPGLAALAAGPARDAGGVYRKAAATEWLATRDRAARHLRRLGVGVEDRDPGALTAALADRYLAIKSAGRL